MRMLRSDLKVFRLSSITYTAKNISSNLIKVSPNMFRLKCSWKLSESSMKFIKGHNILLFVTISFILLTKNLIGAHFHLIWGFIYNSERMNEIHHLSRFWAVNISRSRHIDPHIFPEYLDRTIKYLDHK